MNADNPSKARDKGSIGGDPASHSAPSFWHFAQKGPSKTALVAPSGQEWSRAALRREANRVSHALRSLGLGRGDRVAIMMPNCAEFIAIYLGVTQIGLYLVPINFHFAGPELRYILEDSAAKLLFTHPVAEEAVRSALTEMTAPPSVIVCAGELLGCLRYEGWLRDACDSEPESRMAGDALHYTSGTTGRPKGVIRALPRVTPEERFRPSIRLLQSVFHMQCEAGNVHLIACPLYHSAPLQWAATYLHMGHTLVLADRWSPEAMLRLIEERRVTTSQMVPTQFVRLLRLPEKTRARYDLSSLTHILHGGAPCPRDIKRAMLRWWGPVIYEVYAATEGGGTMTTPAQWMDRPGTVGIPWLPNGIKILDENGHELPPRHPGIVYMRINEMADFGYLGDESKTRHSRRGQYFTVGDVGYLDDDGFLFLCDRKTDVIISGGANIYPAEVESTLIMHPAVADCAVFGIPNDEWGEEVKAVVQPREGFVPGSALTCDILGFLQGKVAKMKWPKSIDYMTALPRDDSGKLFKWQLREPYWQARGRLI